MHLPTTTAKTRRKTSGTRREGKGREGEQLNINYLYLVPVCQSITVSPSPSEVVGSRYSIGNPLLHSFIRKVRLKVGREVLSSLLFHDSMIP